jgi:prevent-host-death family protein
MSSMKISEDFRPLSEMKTHPAKVLRQTARTKRPVVLTRYGRGVAVLMSVEKYEELQVASARLRLIAALQDAERAILDGEVVEHDEMERLLAKWETGG